MHGLENAGGHCRREGVIGADVTAVIAGPLRYYFGSETVGLTG